MIPSDTDGTQFQCIVAEVDKVVVGFALSYPKYSTWEGPCVYLEDLYVTQTHRRGGLGRRLFLEVARRSAQAGCARLQWQVLDWNEPAIAFYKSLNAVIDSTWLNGKLTRDQLQQLSNNN